MPHDLIKGQTILLDDERTFYGDTFQDCRLVLTETGSPRFLNCVFLDCEFDPPILDNLALWQDGKMFGSIVDWPSR
jgi:hypothetical protein